MQVFVVKSFLKNQFPSQYKYLQVLLKTQLFREYLTDKKKQVVV